MACGGAGVMESKFKLQSSDIDLTISSGDILGTQAECFATGEDSGLKGTGAISKLLLKKCPKEYRMARDDLKKKRKRFEAGKIYPCTFAPSSSSMGQGVSFDTVLHVIVPSVGSCSGKKDWKDQMKALYFRMFKTAITCGKSSLALPLLGSGAAGAQIDMAVDVLAYALLMFKPDYDSKASPCCLKHIEVVVRDDAYDKMVSGLTEKQKTVPKQYGLTSQNHNGPVNGGNNPKQTVLSLSDSALTGEKPGPGQKPDRNSSKSATTSSKSATTPKSSCNNTSNLSRIFSGITVMDSQSSDEEEGIGNQNSSSIEVDNASELDGNSNGEVDDKCAICMDFFDVPKKLDKCGHTFCEECVGNWLKHKPVCPTCNTMYGIVTGNQPAGKMTMNLTRQSLQGYRQYGCIVIDYHIQPGIQGREHPKPGQIYHGTSRRAYLPDCEEGRKVYRMLRVAFNNRLIFTVGRSRTTGMDDVVTWNDIHHKTSMDGGTESFGYPDPLYLNRVQEELAAKGITEESLKGQTFDL